MGTSSIIFSGALSRNVSRLAREAVGAVEPKSVFDHLLLTMLLHPEQKVLRVGEGAMVVAEDEELSLVHKNGEWFYQDGHRLHADAVNKLEAALKLADSKARFIAECQAEQRLERMKKALMVKFTTKQGE